MTPPMPPPISHPHTPYKAGSGESSAWVDILRKIGWPTDIVMLDWECYFDKTYRLGKGGLSTIEYVEDRRFEELGVACLLSYGTTRRPAQFWHNVSEQLAHLQAKYGQNLELCTVCAFNARFDGTILARKYGIVPPYCIDVMALSKHLDARNRHNLEEVLERYYLPPKGDTMQFRGLHWSSMTEEERLALMDYSRNDAERQMDLLALLLPMLGRPEIELPLIRHTLRLFWEPELQFDADLAAILIAKMDQQLVADTAAVGATPKEISGNISFVNLLNLALADTGESVAMKVGKKKMIPALAKDDSAVEEYKRHQNPRVRELIKARQAVKSWPLHQKRLRSMTAQADAAGGRLPNPLNYYGAHTGRWSGGEGINTCNLPTRGTGLPTEMKHCLRAPEGCTLIMADAAQIEARGVAWIAGQQDLLDAFAQDRDVYSEFVRENLSLYCRKARKDDPPTVAALYTVRRATGKVPVLGAGYGMGGSRCLEYMETYPELRPKVESGEIDIVFCKRLIDAYRNRYRTIPKFWRDIEGAFKYVTKYGQTQTLRNLTLSKTGHTVRLVLPSGRTLFYPHARVSGSGREERLAWKWGDLWGGTITENIVQAISRDVLAEAVLNIEAQGVRVAHHVYDSVVCAVKKDENLAMKIDIVRQCMVQCPAWATGWPMGVEIIIGDRYE
jgi:DNA polymerase bacteriophage-type